MPRNEVNGSVLKLCEYSFMAFLKYTNTDLNKWKYILYSWKRSFSISKMSFSPCIKKWTQSQYQQVFFQETDRLINFIRKNKQE